VPSQGTHNNRGENAIRPFVIGRKGWLFCDTVPGARASATLYSLVETAKANDLEPHAYLSEVFTRLPHLRACS
jgi:transposase